MDTRLHLRDIQDMYWENDDNENDEYGSDPGLIDLTELDTDTIRQLALDYVRKADRHSLINAVQDLRSDFWIE